MVHYITDQKKKKASHHLQVLRLVIFPASHLTTFPAQVPLTQYQRIKKAPFGTESKRRGERLYMSPGKLGMQDPSSPAKTKGGKGEIMERGIKGDSPTLSVPSMSKQRGIEKRIKQAFFFSSLSLLCLILSIFPYVHGKRRNQR